MHNELVINSKTLISNLKVIKDQIGKSLLCFVVKADAYGHGLLNIAEVSKDYVDYFATYELEDAIKLKQSFKCNVMVFDYLFSQEDIKNAVLNDIEFFLSSSSQINTIDMICNMLKKPAKIHIFVDTGMGREGFNIQELSSAMDKLLEKKDSFEIMYLGSHFTSANISSNKLQMQKLDDAKQILNQKGISFKGISFPSSAVVQNKIHYDMVRVGILPYIGDGIGIYQIAQLYSQVLFVKNLKKGDSISYESNYTLEKDSKVAVVGIGYSHGLRRSLSNKIEFLINGKRYKQVGNICMDQCMILADENVNIGDRVLIYENISEVAHQLSTISYEILVSLKNVNRIMVN